MSYEPNGVDVEDLELGEISCLICEVQIVGEAFYVDKFDGHMCRECVDSYVNDLEAVAKQFAPTFGELSTGSS